MEHHNEAEKSRMTLYAEILEGRMVADVAREIGCSRQNVHARLREHLKRINPTAYAELMDGKKHPPMYMLRINRSKFLEERKDDKIS